MLANPLLPVLLLSAISMAFIAELTGAQPYAPSYVQAAPQIEVDLELVLAVDISRSMDFDEQALQRAGHVEAFRHREVIAAIGSGMIGQIAVTYLEWAGPGVQVHVVPWTLVDGWKTEAIDVSPSPPLPCARQPSCW